MVEIPKMFEVVENIIFCDAKVVKLDGNCWYGGWENIV